MPTFSKRVMKSGNSLFMPLPAMVVDSWELEKGSEIHIEVRPESLRITPVRATKLERIEETDFARLIEAMQEIEVKTSVEDDGMVVRIEFSGSSPDVVKALSENLAKLLPAALSMLGLRQKSSE
jgi:antitoxin component of MazEF toxin-antitoxin module